jgi:4'-phosphopantetheinyl transferase
MNVRFLNVNTVTPEQLALWESWLTQDKRQRITCMPPQKRLLSLCGDALAREMLGEVLHLAPQAVTITESADGKPLTDGAFFSVSHSGDAVICAVSDKPIGIDIEKIRDVRFRTAERFATAEEIEYIGENTERFFEIWTLKEAYFKCIGTGLDSSVKNVSFKINGDKIECSEKGYKFEFLKAAEGYCCSICEKISDAD